MKGKRTGARLLIIIIPCLVFGFFAANLGEAWRPANGFALSDRILIFLYRIPMVFQDPIPKPTRENLYFGIGGALFLLFCFSLCSGKGGNWKEGEEHGSARWGNKKDSRRFEDREFRNNLILTKTERLTMNSRPKDPGTARNKNVLVVGGSGSGKTRYFIKPNLLQCDSEKYPVSFVVSDPKSELLRSCGKCLMEKGYEIRVFNTLDFKKSMHYNPFSYIRSEGDILKFVTALIANTKGEGSAADPFWEKAEVLLYSALVSYIHYECPTEDQNMGTLLMLLGQMEAREEDESFCSPVDLLFEELRKNHPNHIAVLQYTKFKQAAAKTMKSILISAGARLAPFEFGEVREILSFDELALDRIGEKKTALFLIMSDNDPTFNFLIALIYTQLFNRLCERADSCYGGRLPVHVRCLIDEAANVGQIPNLEKLISTIRSREISACLVLQAKSQLKAIYKDNADTIIGNMDAQLFLGGSEPGTLKDLAAALGKETIDSFSVSDTRGNSPSKGMTYQKLGRELMSRDELAVMDGKKCVLQLRGVRPFLSEKYDYTKHPNYRLTGDADPKNLFDVQTILNHQLRLRAADEFLWFQAEEGEAGNRENETPARQNGIQMGKREEKERLISRADGF